MASLEGAAPSDSSSQTVSVAYQPPSPQIRNSSEESFLSISLDALYMKRLSGRQKYLVVHDTIGDLFLASKVMTSRQLLSQFDWELGGRAALMAGPSDKHSGELLFIWVEEWSGAKTARDPFDLAYPFGSHQYTHDYFAASLVRGTYSSKMREGEFNYWHHMTPRNVDYFSFSTIVGLKGFYLGEHIQLTYHKPPDVSTYFAMTKNRLLGIQLGLNLQVNPYQWMSWEITVKGGAYGNDAWAKNWLGDQNNTVLVRAFHGSKLVPSYLVSGDLMIRFRLFPHCMLEIGGGLLGGWNLATAPIQLSRGIQKGSGRRVVATDKVYYQNLLAGLYFDF